MEQFQNQTQQSTYIQPHSPKSRALALVLCLMCGGYGVHRFYTGNIGMGIIYLLTGGIFGIGTIIDAIHIIQGKYTDGNNMPVLE